MPTCLLLTAPILLQAVAAVRPLTTGDFVRQMVDLPALASFPDPTYKTTQFSSTDRRSVAPYAPGWYDNSDGFGGEPIPNFVAVLQEPGEDGVGRYLMAEVEGPGVVARTWTAAINGDVTVYLDDSAEPLFHGSAAEFLGDTYSALAQKAGLITEPPAEGFRQRFASYFPIPFARSLRIEWTGRLRELHFYEVEVRRYPADTPIQTFTLNDLTTYKNEIEDALAVLRSPDTAWRLRQPGSPADMVARLNPGERAELLHATGPAAIQELTLKLESTDPHYALRQVILKGYFDGAPQPQIEAPLGDFFGSGPGINPYDSLPMTVRPDGSMTCRFLMPFRHSALLVAENRGSQPVNLRGQAALVTHSWDDERSLYFFAKWRVNHGLLASGGNQAFDLPFLSARGKGVYVGTAAMILNPSSVPTSGGNWWGEGDEKVWVDDDTYPSLFGTGSEDYFNYAWSAPDLFHYAYCAQPLTTGPDNRGFVSNIRWHILDALPFQERIGFFMELWTHTPTPNLSYGRLAYFYATPHLRDDFVPIQTADVTQGLELPENWQPVAAGAARGAAFYQAEKMLAAEREDVEVVEGRMWSAGKLLRWRPRAEGDSLQLQLSVEKAGRYQLVITTARTPASGRYSAAIDGGPDLEPVDDLYTPHHTMLRNTFFTPSPLELTAGNHILTLTARGKNEASRGTEVGVDFVWLVAR